jgi:hypothetical protein
LFANLYVSSATSHPRKVKLNARYVLAKPNTEPHAARASRPRREMDTREAKGQHPIGTNDSCRGAC